jgi:hypothetical protein
MKQNSFTTAIEVNQTSEEVFKAITGITKWWTEDFEGSSTQLNDEFTVHHPGQHYSKQKLIEVIPYKKIVWLVTESTLYWLKNDKDDWTNTKMIFEISSHNDKTILHFTHDGLTPEKESFFLCQQGWNVVINDWLYHFISVGEPSIRMKQAAEIRSQLLENK